MMRLVACLVLFTILALQGCLSENEKGEGGPSSTRGFFRITFPTSGSSLDLDATYQVLWTPDPKAEGGDVLIALYQGDAFRAILAAGVPNNGTYPWRVSETRDLSGNRVGSGGNYRLRFTSALDTSKWDFSDAFSIHSRGIDPDGYENDDSLKLAKPIEVGGKAQQHTLTDQDMDWMRFPAVQDKRYLVSVKGATRVTAWLADSAGAFAGFTMTGTNFDMMVYTPKTGRHHLRVSADSLGPYSIGISEDTAQLFPDAVFIAPDSTTTWAAGFNYDVKWVPDSLFYGNSVNLQLYNDTMRVREIASSTSNIGYYPSYLDANLATSSKYRIRIANSKIPQIFSYSPRFTITALAADAYEQDDVRASAKILPADGIPQSRTIMIGDQDWIRLDVKAGRKYLAYFKHPHYRVTLTDSSGVALGAPKSDPFYIAIPISPTYDGPHYLHVEDTGDMGHYNVLLVEYDMAQGGYPVKFTSPDSGSLWAVGSSYTIRWVPDEPLLDSFGHLFLYNDTVRVLEIVRSLTNTGSYEWSVPAGLVTSSRYRVRYTNGYLNQIFGYSKAFTITGIAADAFEADNQRSQAKDISVDGMPQSRNHTDNDSDWVKFDGVAGKTYFLNVKATHTLSLHAYDSAGSLLASDTGKVFSLVVKPAKDGKVYARAQPVSGTGSYTLSALAHESGPHGLRAGFIKPDSSSTCAAGSFCTITWIPDTLLFGSDVSLDVYADTAFIKTLIPLQANSGSLTILFGNGFASGADYRIRMTSRNNPLIYGSSAPFTITGMAPDAQEPNNSPAAARVATPNQARQTLSLSYRDRDWFKFTGKAGMLYFFETVSGASLPTIMRLYSGLGAMQLSVASKTSSDSVTRIAWVCPADGQYSLFVEPNCDCTSYYGSYSFEIKEMAPATARFTVTGPVQDAVVKIGQSQLIKWTDPLGVKGLVHIDLYNSEGKVQTLTPLQDNTGSYNWSVPTTLTSRSGYSVRVLSILDDAIGGSSGTFTISP